MDMWDVFQQRQINAADTAAQNARETADRVGDKLHREIQRLDGKIEGLALVCEALWELLRENTQLTNADIRNKIHEIDIRDGRADGRITGQPYDCRSCHRPVHTNHSRCIWCGVELVDGPVSSKYK